MPSDTIRVLLVDDVLEREDHVDDMLASAGFETRTANNSVLAVGALEVWGPVLVVVDLRFPARETHQFCSDLAARPADRRPLVVLIGEGSNLLKEMSLVPDGLVPTPVDPDRLVATVTRTVRDAVGASEASLGSR
jgi:CheY-like chemotaxis protein